MGPWRSPSLFWLYFLFRLLLICLIPSLGPARRGSMHKTFSCLLAATLIGCGAAPMWNSLAATPLENSPAVAPCYTTYRTYFGDKCRVRFNLPPEFWPRYQGWENTECRLRLDWHPRPGALQRPYDLVGFYLDVQEYGCDNLDDFVATETDRITREPQHYTLIRDEPFILDSGQDGWLLVATSAVNDGLIVQCLTLGTRMLTHGDYGGCVSLKGTGYGSDTEGEEILDYLLGVCRTLCAE